MWEAAKAANVPYFEPTLEKIKAISVDAYAALANILRVKWKRCAFRKGTNCPMLVNNWAEAFNKVILREREKPILSMLNNIHYTVMQWLQSEHEIKSKWQGSVCPWVDELLKKREKLTRLYVTRSCENSKYSVTIDVHAFVVDIKTMECSFGLWQLGGIPCMNVVCVYQSHNKNRRAYVHRDFSKAAFLEVYSHFSVPIRGPINWPKTIYPDILPPNISELSGRPKRIRHIDASEARERAEKEKQARTKMDKATGDIVYKAG